MSTKESPRRPETTFAQYLDMANNVRKNLLRIYRKQKWEINHMLLFPVFFVYEEILLKLFGPSSLFSNLLYLIFFGLSYGLICTALTSAFKPKVNRIISTILLYVTALLFVVECLIRDSYQVYMTIGAIKTGAGGVMTGFGGELLSAIFGGIPKILIFFLPALLYTATGRRRMPARRYQLPFVAAILVVSLIFTGFSVLIANVGKNGDKYDSQFDFNTATQTFGLLTSVRLNTKYELLGNDSGTEFILENAPDANDDATSPLALSLMEGSLLEDSEPLFYQDNVLDLDFSALADSASSESDKSIHTYVNSLTPSTQNKYTGLFEGKNLILICAEAFSDVVISEELTPTLYRLVHNGFYFSDFYQPTWGGSTSSGEYSFVTGLAPTNGVDSMQDCRENNNYFTLGNQLQRLGYYSCSYHNGYHDFYDRYLTHPNLGYSQFLGFGNGLEEIQVPWTDDIAMFEATMDTYIDKQPFSIYYMTISGHCTYDSDDARVEKYLAQVEAYLGDEYKDTTKYYYCYQLVLEDALTTMINKLEAAGIADDTVICMTADHYPYGLEVSATFGNSEDYVTDLYGYTYTNSWEQDHNTLIIWSGCLENDDKEYACEISEPTYSLDIVPTLSNLFGLEYDSRLLVGRDVFSDTDPLVLWTNYSWITTQGKYDSATRTFYPNPGYENDEEYIARIKQIVANKLNYSKQVLDTDYYYTLFGPDDVT